MAKITIFLSTLPARGATVFTPLVTQVLEVFLSTLPARGATWKSRKCSTSRSLFLSTLPARGATGHVLLHLVPELISIHAPREGSDLPGYTLQGQCCDFYPRSPRGERQSKYRVS